MTKKVTTKPLAAALGAVLATSLVSIPAANADENPFDMTKLSSGYMVAESHDETDPQRPGTGIVPSKGSHKSPAEDMGGEAVEGTDVEKPGTGIVPGSGSDESSEKDVGGEAVEGTDAEKPGT